jgi:dCMP deaminase
MDHVANFRLAFKVAIESPDPSTQTGAVILDGVSGDIISEGCNEFPGGVRYTDERLERPLKYKYIEHAERNAIFGLLRNHYDIPRDADLVMYALWAACADCARAIIQSGIRKLYTHGFYMDEDHANWDESISVAFEMLTEAGVQVFTVHDQIMESGETLRYNGVSVHF